VPCLLRSGVILRAYSSMQILMPPGEKPLPGIRLICGSLAGATSVFFTYP
jgi:hypothetical protein